MTPLSTGATLMAEGKTVILVGYGSKHGATAEIAERIADILTLAGQPAEARPVQQAGDLGGYQGFVIGSAAYQTHWRKDATAFVMSNHPRDHHVFFGSLDPSRLTFAEKTLRKLPAARAIMPEGDFRDWTEIEDWARSIAEELTYPDAGQVGGIPDERVTAATA